MCRVNATAVSKGWLSIVRSQLEVAAANDKDLTDIMDNIAKVHKQFMKKKKKFSEEEIRQKNQFLMEVMQEAKLAIPSSIDVSGL